MGVVGGGGGGGGSKNEKGIPLQNSTVIIIL